MTNFAAHAEAVLKDVGDEAVIPTLLVSEEETVPDSNSTGEVTDDGERNSTPLTPADREVLRWADEMDSDMKYTAMGQEIMRKAQLIRAGVPSFTGSSARAEPEVEDIVLTRPFLTPDDFNDRPFQPDVKITGYSLEQLTKDFFIRTRPDLIKVTGLRSAPDNLAGFHEEAIRKEGRCAQRGVIVRKHSQ